MNYQAQCKCGSKSYVVADRKAAEVLADQHEAQHSVHRAYQHDAVVVEVAR